MAQPDPDSREFRQMRHDVDDVYQLLTETQRMVASNREATGAVWSAQQRHGTRLEEIQQALDLQNIRMDRMEDAQRRQGEHLGRIDENQRRQGEHLGRVEDAQREQGDRLGRVEDAQREQGDRLGRVEDGVSEILALLRGSSG